MLPCTLLYSNILSGELTSCRWHKPLSGPQVYQNIYINIHTHIYIYKGKSPVYLKNKETKCGVLPKQTRVPKESLLLSTKVIRNVSKGPWVKWQRLQMQQILQVCLFSFLSHHFMDKKGIIGMPQPAVAAVSFVLGRYKVIIKSKTVRLLSHTYIPVLKPPQAFHTKFK